MIIIKNASGEIIKVIDADINKTLLSQLQDEGIEITYACHTGICGACMCQIESGSDNVQKSFRGEPGFPLGDDEVMTCIAGVINKDEDIILKTIY
ncbi:MAG: 2Fe-2S iron-sulfur cluster binding domain-containing protein [Candidatus Gracilibacteria bacterium]|nr:2Fe-2S iron-sulfur cluster binding domain-containing protein [Candidatus Gracilibacteria bacterium]